MQRGMMGPREWGYSVRNNNRKKEREEFLLAARGRSVFLFFVSIFSISDCLPCPVQSLSSVFFGGWAGRRARALRPVVESCTKSPKGARTDRLDFWWCRTIVMTVRYKDARDYCWTYQPGSLERDLPHGTVPFVSDKTLYHKIPINTPKGRVVCYWRAPK